ncbi:hypothetical protein MTAT_16610 [Moorella thermoacetica]|uniref:Bacterial type II secretion system protein F domain protein n=1 Tax=Neomoorella thermoacetica TaxID=1525 RepID=A0A1D7X8A2_NEOTH|nr:type II secretion system F family protein [Moorella thermoacetica]AOQ23131.1 Bacterial type II secretion system protein F domain protein [Moorella thermoacetica]OIQ59751.1 bacterial type II secretion system protein F domain protein [Moorella thermoacetica]TYL12838.1 hypothetical protein MTAT_16610 [Moorella thermoacetica]
MPLVKSLAVILGAAAVFIAVWNYVRPRNVAVDEEWKMRSGTVKGGARLVYFLIGVIVCVLGGYGVTGQPHLAALASIGGVFFARLIERRKAATRLELLRSQYAAVLSSMVSALQGGLSPYQALEDAVPSMPRPARDIFAEMLRQTRTGTTFVQAAENVLKATGWSDLKSMVVALRIYSRTGCNLVEVFQHILESNYERQNDRRYVAAVTSESRVTALMLSFLPFFLMGICRVMAPDFIAPLFTTLAGNVVIVVCVIMVVVGNVIVGKMVKGVAGDA